VDLIGKLLVMAGLALTVIGGLIWLASGKGRGGFLPGDIAVERGEFRFYFPLMTCLVVSLLLTLVLRLIRR